MLLDGFDLVVLGTVLPSLLDYEPWHLTPGSASLISVVGLVGMAIGAHLHRHGHRRHRPS